MVKQVSLEMQDPVFAPGDTRTAVVPITVKPSGLSCQAEVFLGPNDTTKVATSGLVAFTSTGVAQSVRCPITMPAAGGVAYHVYIDVYANGYLILRGQATKDVTIPSVVIGPITWE